MCVGLAPLHSTLPRGLSESGYRGEHQGTSTEKLYSDYTLFYSFPSNSLGSENSFNMLVIKLDLFEILTCICPF